ncbi:MAG: hypothetical protein ACXACY_29330 [Candidatus Hodarchaeales archaeon]
MGNNFWINTIHNTKTTSTLNTKEVETIEENFLAGLIDTCDLNFKTYWKLLENLCPTRGNNNTVKCQCTHAIKQLN